MSEAPHPRSDVSDIVDAFMKTLIEEIRYVDITRQGHRERERFGVRAIGEDNTAYMCTCSTACNDADAVYTYSACKHC